MFIAESGRRRAATFGAQPRLRRSVGVVCRYCARQAGGILRLRRNVHGLSFDTIYALAAFACAFAGAVYDVRTRRIPNWLTGPGILLGLSLHLLLGGWRSLSGSLAGGLLAGFVFLLFHLAGGMGAGDVKLITAVCCLAGLSAVAGILLGTALLGGLFAVALALLRHRLKDTLANMGRLVVHHGCAGLRPHPQVNLTNPGTLRLPYGLAIAAGAGSSLCSVLLR
jgi:prepilin peptidase CpaA